MVEILAVERFCFKSRHTNPSWIGVPSTENSVTVRPQTFKYLGNLIKYSANCSTSNLDPGPYM